MLPSEIVQQVKRIQMRTGKDVADVLAGAYLSVFKGRGMEFEEVRPYVPGDDVRSIDWNVTARTGEPFVKRYVEERELTVMLLVDISGSQEFGSGRRSKREAAVELSALLAFSAAYNQDKVGLIVFSDHIERFIPPRKGQKHALRIIRELLAGDDANADLDTERATSWRGLPLFVRRKWRELIARTQGRPARARATDIAQALEFCRRVLPRRAVLFLVSDFIDDDFAPMLRHANRKHDVVAVLVSDQREADVAPVGLVTVRDAETGDRRVIDTSSQAFRDELVRRADARVRGLTAELRASKIDLMHIDADAPVLDPLLGFFRARERRLRR